jgi:hypothetical protein
VYPIGAVGCSSSELEPELPSPRRGDPGPGQAGREREKTKSEKVVNAGNWTMSLTTGAPNATVTNARTNAEGSDKCMLVRIYLD